MIRAEVTGKMAFTLWDSKGECTAIHDCGHMCKWWVIDRFDSEKGGCCNCRGYGMLTYSSANSSKKYTPCVVCICAT